MLNLILELDSAIEIGFPDVWVSEKRKRKKCDYLKTSGSNVATIYVLNEIKYKTKKTPGWLLKVTFPCKCTGALNKR